LVGDEEGLFPGLVPVGLSSQAIPRNEVLGGGFNTLQHLPDQLYQPDIAPATTEYVSRGHDLSNFRTLAGDPPTLTGYGAWIWNGVSNVTVLAQDVAAADAAQTRLFWSGILIGVAGAGVFALALELIGLGEKLNIFGRPKGAAKAKREATPGHQRRRSSGVRSGNSSEPREEAAETSGAGSPALPPSQQDAAVSD
jgi:hypothetical protein